MADYPKELEIDRLINIVKVFGWEKVKEVTTGEDVEVTLKKTIHAEGDVTGAPVPT